MCLVRSHQDHRTKAVVGPTNLRKLLTTIHSDKINGTCLLQCSIYVEGFVMSLSPPEPGSLVVATL